MKVLCDEACKSRFFDDDLKKWICIREEIYIGKDQVCKNFSGLKSSVGWYGRSEKELGTCR
jgi:hypothetical protein